MDDCNLKWWTGFFVAVLGTITEFSFFVQDGVGLCLFGGAIALLGCQIMVCSLYFDYKGFR